MDVLAGIQIRTKGKNTGAARGVELEHFDGVAQVEVEDLIGVEDVHFRERARLKQVVDCRALMTHAARQCDGGGGGVSAAIETSFGAVRFEMEERFDFVGSHDAQCYQRRHSKMEA